MTLDEDHLNWCALKGLATDYQCTNFHDNIDDIVQENANVTVFQDFPSASVTMTLDEGHTNSYNLKGLVPNYHCGEFPEYLTTVAKENLPRMHQTPLKPIFSEWPTHYPPHINACNLSIFKATIFVLISNCSGKSADYESVNIPKTPRCDLRLNLPWTDTYTTLHVIYCALRQPQF